MREELQAVTILWPSFRGYQRVGAISVLNIFGFRVTRVGCCLKAGFGQP